MIVVGGFNTSVDTSLEVDALVPGQVLRARRSRTLPGGKGLHVALTVAALGEKVCLVGVLDQAQRPRFEGFLAARGVVLDPVMIAGEVRSCLAVHDAAGVTTEILEPGPTLAPGERDELCDRFLRRAGGGELAVLSGSLPPGCGPDTYRDLVTSLSERGVPCLVDASGEALRMALDARPHGIKPNRDEASALVGRALASVEDAAVAAREVGETGCALVVISLGPEGAVACAAGRVCHAMIPARPIVNAVGSGDCLLGGLVVGLRRGLALDEALRLGVACGTANALGAETGVVGRQAVEALRPSVTVRWLS